MNLLPIDETKSKRKKEIDERETRGREHEGKRKKENVKKENVKIINQEADKERKKREKGASPFPPHVTRSTHSLKPSKLYPNHAPKPNLKKRIKLDDKQDWHKSRRRPRQ